MEQEVYYFEEGMMSEGLCSRRLPKGTTAYVSEVAAMFDGYEAWFLGSEGRWTMPNPSMRAPRGHMEGKNGIFVKLVPARSEASSKRSRQPLPIPALAADFVANAVGSWKFIGFQACVFLTWFIVLVAQGDKWDSMPFFYLNLTLSVQAAFTGPVILVSQNRQAADDRLKFGDLGEKIDDMRQAEAMAIWDAVNAHAENVDALTELYGTRDRSTSRIHRD